MSSKQEPLVDGLLDVGLVEHLQADALLGAVIRGHLYIEAPNTNHRVRPSKHRLLTIGTHPIYPNAQPSSGYRLDF